jgi:flavodoxin
MPAPTRRPPVPRRTLLRAALGGAGMATALTACTAPTPSPDPTGGTASMSPTPAGPVLVAYFSRAGENYYYGGRRVLQVGNTEVLAGMITDRLDCDVYRIEEAQPYPENYDDTVARNAAEQNADARPAIANPLPDLTGYATVLIGSPIWNVRAPMIMSTFLEALDFTGTTILPFTTHAMSGLGTVPRDYTALAPTATIGPGLAVRGEEVRDAAADTEQWLGQVGLLDR